MKRLLFAGILMAAPAHVDTVCPDNTICPTCKPICYETERALPAAQPIMTDADQGGFWVGDRYYWPNGDNYYNRRTRAYTWLDRSVPTMADAPSWLRYPMQPRWQVIGRSRCR